MNDFLQRLKTFDFWVEIASSITTLIGMYLGSTTLWGAAWYLIAIVVWYVLIYRQKLWGILPMNLACNVIAIVNLCRALNL
jgi:hypothetical protein